MIPVSFVMFVLVFFLPELMLSLVLRCLFLGGSFLFLDWTVGSSKGNFSCESKWIIDKTFLCTVRNYKSGSVFFVVVFFAVDSEEHGAPALFKTIETFHSL